MSERDLIGLLSRLFAPGASGVTRRRSRVATVGIGDDAAVLKQLLRARGKLVWTVDVSVDGVHFDRRLLSLPDVGARSFHAAVSDIAAMGGRPLAALSSLVVPPRLGTGAVRKIAEGQARAARELNCPVIGGNLSRGGELSVTTTVLGVAKRPLTRAGARPGDEVWLLGEVGLAAAGLRFLLSNAPPRRKGGVRSPGSGRTATLTQVRSGEVRERRALGVCIAAWKCPRALVREGLRLGLHAHAAVDVSDGLGGDAGHLAEASAVRVVLEEAALRRVLTPALLGAAKSLGLDALGLALAGGEDYALVATGPRHKRPRGARRIGRVVKGRGIVLETADGQVRPVASGFDHFGGRSV